MFGAMDEPLASSTVLHIKVCGSSKYGLFCMFDTMMSNFSSFMLLHFLPKFFPLFFFSNNLFMPSNFYGHIP